MVKPERMKRKLHAIGWSLLASCLAATAQAKAPAKPAFGENVLVFDPAMPAAEMQQKIDKVYAAQQHSEFGTGRYALLFLPGEYHVDVPIGFYTQVAGLGATPDAVRIVGNVHSDATLPHNNATCTFWRSVEGFSVTPTGGTMQWAVSQAAPFRRMHVKGNIVLHQNGGWASGGWMADSVVDGNVGAGPQQQWISRNSEWGSWTGANWNMVFVGVPNPPAGEWPTPPYTKIARTPIVREKPFLEVDATGKWSVRIPALRTESQGVTWHGGSTPGRSIPLDGFYVAHAGADTAAAINAQLASGKNLLFTPGIYELSEPIRVTRPGTVVMGLGFATLKPTSGAAAMTTADADGIEISGLLFDAGEAISPVLLEIGPAGSKAGHAKNPIVLHDVFFRVGGAGVGRVAAKPRDQQQRHDRGPHLDMARRSWRRCWLDEQRQCQRSGRERKQRHDLRALCRAPSGVPGAVEGQLRPHVFLSVRDSIRSAGSGELHERARHQWLGVV